jgi:hypothetical protein
MTNNETRDIFPIAYEILESFAESHDYTFEFERDIWNDEEIAQIEIDGQDDDDYICLLHESGRISNTEFNLDGVTPEFENAIHEWRQMMFERLGSVSVKDAFIAAVTNDLPHPTKGM